ncbi:hypothetical protein [Aliarcobacter butzleri]|uniref:Uncharacterized protein n=1 Tax=Aliarcobacter butzleri L348 TaxID=1447256 RepID=A0A0G9K3D4_9BACT|nr:hypothetical protein [Aliarcobacter butzleri]KLD98662.1 hypothetical protein AA20_08195 [Aliarcobacter butzleri L348]
MENYIKINEANKTKIVCKKEIIENLRTNENLRNYIIHCTNSIFKDKEIFNKQKIIAIKNLVKDIKLVLKSNNIFDYNLNLTLRNLNEYYNQQKNEIKDENGKIKNFIPSSESQFIIQSLIFLAFSNSYSKIIKSIYVK